MDENSSSKSNTHITTGDLSASEGSSIVIAGRDAKIGFTAADVQALMSQLEQEFQPQPFTGECPYLGLEAFQEHDAGRFFGREAQISELLARVEKARFIMVAGPSGSGKSSLVRAGLLAQLKSGALPGSRSWLYATLSPGRHPLEKMSLAVGRMGKAPQAAEYLRQRAGHQPGALDEAVETLLSDDPQQRALIFVDQFEELFTQPSQERGEEKTVFIRLLDAAVSRQDGRVSVICAMRSDFLPQCAAFPRLNRLLNQQFLHVGAMQPDELVRAIALPAVQVGLRLDPDLIAQVVNDMGAEPGSLPLMQFALKDLFDAMQTDQGVQALSLSDYLQRGGLHKALERHANAQFQGLSQEEQGLAESIFRGLVETGPGTADTRRMARLHELVPAGSNLAQVRGVIQRLADARLLITDEQGEQEPIVTIAHERLLDAWPWLHRLVDENRQVINLQNQINDDALDWDQHGRDPSYLYTRARLATAREQLDEGRIILPQLSEEFIRSGVEQEISLRRSAERRRNLLLLATSLTAVVMIILSSWALYQSSRLGDALEESNLRGTQVATAGTRVAEQASTATFLLSEAERLGTQAAAEAFAAQTAEAQAQQQAQVALARQLAAQSQANQQNFPARSLLLAVEALRASQPRQPAAETQLRAALAIPPSIPLPAHQSSVQSVAFSPDGHWLASSDKGGKVLVWDRTQAPLEPQELPIQVDVYGLLFFSPDGRWLASVDEERVYLWFMGGGEDRMLTLEAGNGSVITALFSPDGRWLAAGGYADRLRVWSMAEASPDAPPPAIDLPVDGKVAALAFHPDGGWLAEGSSDGQVYLYFLAGETSGLVTRGLQTDTITQLVFQPDGKRLVSVSFDGSLAVWDTSDLDALLQLGEPLAPLVYSPQAVMDNVDQMAFSPDGSWLGLAINPEVFTGGNGELWLYDLRQGSDMGFALPLVLSRGHGIFSRLIFSPDGRWLAASSHESLILFWDLEDLDPQEPGSLVPLQLRGHEGAVNGLAFSPEGEWLASGGADGFLRLWQVSRFGPSMSTDPLPLFGLKSGIDRFTFDPDGSRLYAADIWGRAFAWDAGDFVDGSPPAVDVLGLRASDNDGAFSPDTRLFAISDTSTQSISVWNLARPGRAQVILESFSRGVSALVFSSDGSWLAAGDYGGAVRLWDLSSLETIRWDLQAHDDAVDVLAFSLNGRWLASGARDARLHLVDLDDPDSPARVLEGHTGFISGLVFSRDGRWLVSSDYRGALLLWDLVEGEAGGSSLDALRLVSDADYISSLDFSPDGHWLAAGSENGSVYLWDLETAAPAANNVMRLLGHEGEIEALAFSRDGKWLATGSSDLTIRLWDLSTALDGKLAEPVLLRGHATAIIALAFSPDGRWLVSGARDTGFAAGKSPWETWGNLWDLDLATLQVKACALAGRNFSLYEWQQFFPDQPYRQTCPGLFEVR